uniref:Uncharacterized protein n=1 Tax=Arundo donax TaxID=35708 RepID=A0A0A9AIL5_ARUDO
MSRSYGSPLLGFLGVSRRQSSRLLCKICSFVECIVQSGSGVWSATKTTRSDQRRLLKGSSGRMILQVRRSLP